MYDSCLVVSVSSFRYTAAVGLNLRPTGKEVTLMEYFLSFVVTVAAGTAVYYICKWLDRHKKDKADQHEYHRKGSASNTPFSVS